MKHELAMDDSCMIHEWFMDASRMCHGWILDGLWKNLGWVMSFSWIIHSWFMNELQALHILINLLSVPVIVNCFRQTIRQSENSEAQFQMILQSKCMPAHDLAFVICRLHCSKPAVASHIRPNTWLSLYILLVHLFSFFSFYFCSYLFFNFISTTARC